MLHQTLMRICLCYDNCRLAIYLLLNGRWFMVLLVLLPSTEGTHTVSDCPMSNSLVL